MKKNRTQKDILFILISSFILVVLWIGFDLWHRYVTSTINPDLQMQISPINPDFDMQALQKIKIRDRIVPQYEVIDNTTPTPPPSGLQTPGSQSINGSTPAVPPPPNSGNSLNAPTQPIRLQGQ